MVFSGSWPKLVDQPTWTIRTPPRVPDGLPELFKAIAEAQDLLGGRARTMSHTTEHYRVIVSTMHALARLVELWANPEIYVPAHQGGKDES